MPSPHETALAGVGQRLLLDYMQPRTRELQQDTTQLHSALQEYCARPADGTRRALVEQQLGNTVAAWARVELLRFGPLVEDNRLENFFFWPDPRGAVQRQVRGLLAAADPAVLEQAQLRQQSAAVQGLPALEYALYADGAPLAIAGGDAAGRFRCSYATGIAANLTRLATAVATGWSGSAPLAAEFARPAAHRTVYRSHGEVATEALKALSTALHAARDQKLAPALGESAAAARGALLPLYRSELTTRYLAAGVGAAAQFYATSRLGAALSADEGWIDAALGDELRRVQEDLAALELPATRAVADEGQRDLLVHAALVLANARAIVDEYLAPALGVSLGFNALDGD